MTINELPKRQKPLSRIKREKYDGTARFNQLPNKDNRAEQIKRSDDIIKNYSVGLQDIDEAIMYFFKQIIKPKVFENGTSIDVPVMYGDAEFWYQVQNKGYARDKKGKIIAPVVMFKRTNIAKDDSVSIDKADRNIVHVLSKKWSNEHNKYDRFSLTHNIQPTKELYSIVVPDYIILNYECSIWTSYITQMNKIIEMIQYWEGHYWGDETKFKFKAKFDSFDQAVEISTDKGRIARSNFTLEIRGYLIPEVANDQITTQKSYTKQQIILENETEIDILSLSQTDPLSQKILVTTNKQPALSGNQTITDLVNTAIINFQAQINYLRKMSVYSSLTAPGATVESGSISVVTYPNVYTASVPTQSSLLATREEDFLVFVNGQYMEHDAFTIQQSGSNFVINANTGSLGYELNDTDEIVVWGKFDG